MEQSEDRLRGFCSITFDDSFVVRDLKIIEGNNGPFVAMPSRKLTSHCHKCRSKNHLRSRFCNQCGTRLRNEQITHDQTGRARLYADIAHPVNAACREMIQNRVIEEFENELKLSKQPGYVSRYDDEYDAGPNDWDEQGNGNSSRKTAVEHKSIRQDSSQELKNTGPHKSDGKETIDSKREDSSVEQANRKDDDFGRGILD